MKHEFTDLVLLIGKNPLPNYIVARYFLKNLQRIWFVHSEKTDYSPGTKEYADNIKNVLDKQINNLGYKVGFIYCPLYDSGHADEIYKGMCQHLDKKIKDLRRMDPSIIPSFHLNYTGGTKAMAVHVYRAMEHKLKSNMSYSYLDARDYCIKFDNNSDMITDDLRTEIDLEFKDLFNLHGYEFIEDKSKYMVNIDSTAREGILKGIALLANNNKLNELKEWSNLVFNKKDKSVFSDYKRDKQPELFSLLAAFPGNDKLVNDQGEWIHENLPISKKSKNSKQLNNFLTGKWLESYVAWVLSTKIKEYGCTNSEVLTNFRVEPLIKSLHFIENRKDFEIDVIVSNGYQICAISCGTSQKEKEIKNKGFEVILRSRQLGGEEARSVLVTLLDQETTEKIQDDLRNSLGAEHSHFIVLGEQDLAVDKMWKKLRQFIYD